MQKKDYTNFLKWKYYTKLLIKKNTKLNHEILYTEFLI